MATNGRTRRAGPNDAGVELFLNVLAEGALDAIRELFSMERFPSTK
jgi:hypothetical protein